MSFDLTGILNQNEYYTNHYFSSIFEENAADTISQWREKARNSETERTPWALLKDIQKLYYPFHERYLRSRFDTQLLANIRTMADAFLSALGYPKAEPVQVQISEELNVPVYLELKKSNGAPLLWVLLAASPDKEEKILEKKLFNSATADENINIVHEDLLTSISNEELANKILFGIDEPPRFLLFMGMNQIALLDRNKWNEKRYLQFELDEIFSRREETTFQSMAVLLHKESLCPNEGTALIDQLDANSQKHAAGVSQDLKYALRESIELLGNEVLYDLANRKGRNLTTDPVDAGDLTLQCLRYMYRMLFVLFIEARPELGYAPIKSQSYYSGYSLESLRDVAENIRDDVEEVGSGYFLHETLAKLYDLIYTGYPKTEEEVIKYSKAEGLHDMFVIQPLKAHIFDPEYTKLITDSKIRNCVMLKIIDLMSLTRSSGRRNERRGRISYANLGINQLGAVYEALLSYRGFIAAEDLYEVKKEGDKFNELDVGFFVKESELNQYTENERVRYESGENKGKLRMYKKGTFIYRLAGREREKSASYYTPEVLTKCLVKYALKELLKDKTADEILNLTVCEPAMGSAAFLNEAINQLAEAYLDKKQKELGDSIPYDQRFNELQKVKMYIADRNVYGIDLNPTAVELAEVSLWLNTIHTGGFVPWFGTQLVNGNSLIGARRQVYTAESLRATSQGLRWYELSPERLPFGAKRNEGIIKSAQIYHFLVGDPGMANYSDKVIKSLEEANIKKINEWNKNFNKPYGDEDITTLTRLSSAVDKLWESQIELRKRVWSATQDNLSVYGHKDDTKDSHTTIRQKDKIFSNIYKTEHMQNAGPYARLKFAMDYWCSLWFWPVEKADLLPSRSEFFFDMSLILEGTINSVEKVEDFSLFPEYSTMSQEAKKITDTYGIDSVVDLDDLCKKSGRLALSREIAERNRFMHWELEFADLFADRGGFDLIIGNPPWVLLGWNEQSVLADSYPIFAIKNLTAAETVNKRIHALENIETKKNYFEQYESLIGQQNFLNASQNYSDLVGMKANLYKCFLPQSWNFGKSNGICAFVHPDGVFDDPKGDILRTKIYPRLKYHFSFINALNLFDVDWHTTFSLNVYSNLIGECNFQTMFNVFSPSTIDESFGMLSLENTKIVPGIKDSNNNWDTTSHSHRIIHITKENLAVLANVFGDEKGYLKTALPQIHCTEIFEALKEFVQCRNKVENINDNIYISQMWNETNATKESILAKKTNFSDSPFSTIYSGTHISLLNPLFKSSQRVCESNRSFDNIDLTQISDSYIQRTNYIIKCSMGDYTDKIPKTQWGELYNQLFRIYMRKMIDCGGERTLISCIVPPIFAHIHGILGFACTDIKILTILAGSFSSLPFDFFVRIMGKSNMGSDILEKIPILNENKFVNSIILRTLMLNCLTKYFATIWENSWQQDFAKDSWAKSDSRLNNAHFLSLKKEWSHETPLRTDFERREALVELDVLTAMALGMTLEQLKTIYRIQFPVMQQYEIDTWYDSTGRIVFTTNRSLTDLGFTRTEWENGIKGAAAGQKFTRTITDDTQPGGPKERTIEYVAPFTKCNREQDYETVWNYFEEKFNNN